MKAIITAFSAVLLFGAIASEASALSGQPQCPAPGDNRDCVFYREVSKITSESLALAAYGAESPKAGRRKAKKLQHRLCNLVEEYEVPKPAVCEAERMEMLGTARVDWIGLIEAICAAIVALLN